MLTPVTSGDMRVFNRQKKKVMKDPNLLARKEKRDRRAAVMAVELWRSGRCATKDAAKRMAAKKCNCSTLTVWRAMRKLNVSW